MRKPSTVARGCMDVEEGRGVAGQGGMSSGATRFKARGVGERDGS